MSTKYIGYDSKGAELFTISSKKTAIVRYEGDKNVHGIETDKGTCVHGEPRTAKVTKSTAKKLDKAGVTTKDTEAARLEANRKQREARQKLADRKDSEIVIPKNKHCNKCDTDKKAAEFYANRRYKDGLFPWCKDCYRSYAKDYVAKKQQAAA